KKACIPTVDTSISECGCLEINDPRVSCKKACIPTTDTPINECSCLVQNDPREQCQKTCIPIENPYSCVPSYSTPISECPCLEINDPRAQCKKACIPTSTTPISEQCPCFAVNDPREACQTSCIPIDNPQTCVPTADTPVNECQCLALNDPRIACKKACIPTVDTSISECGCLEINDPRVSCKKACIPTTDTPINECSCLVQNDPREQCQKTCIPSINTPIEECPCFEINDPRALCKRACIPTEYTSISECACLEINDPRVSCKKACIPTTDTPINECSCLIQNDPREQCQKTCIPIENPYSCVPSYSTPISECPCLELNDPRAQCKKACIPTSTTPISEQCPCFAVNDPREACQTSCIPIDNPQTCVPTESTPITQCGCLEINDPRQACNPKQEILIPPQDIPDIPNITISPEVIKEIIINIVDRNEVSNSVQNHIYEAILDQNSIEIQVQSNEIYEEQNIHVAQNHKLVLNALNSSSNNPTPPPVLRPSDTNNEQVQPFGLISGAVEISQFLIEHFTQQSQVPLLKTEGDGILRLNNVTLSANKHSKSYEGATITAQTSSTEKTSPFLQANGKLILLYDVVIEPTNFKNCNAILLNGTKGANNHQFFAENSNFQIQLNNTGGQSFLNSQGFTVVIKGSTFKGQKRNNRNEISNKYTKKSLINEDEKKTCEWSTASVNIVDGVGFFENTTFKGLSEGALKIGKGGIVTLKQSVLLYDNKPTETSKVLKDSGRNIICEGTLDSPSQLLAESSSFREVEPDGNAGLTSINKWVVADKTTCKITGSLGQEKLLLYTPQIQSIRANGNYDKTGINVVIQGKSLFGCGKLYLQVSAVPEKKMNADPTVKQYKLADVATYWGSDTSISASIAEDDLVQKGKKLTVSVLVQTDDNSLHEAELVAGGSNTAEVTDFGKGGLSAGAIVGIVVSVVAVIAVVTIIIIVFIAYLKKKREAQHNKGSENVTQVEQNSW
ncbi:MAG: hypothetical protein EZS28_031923, partial [Streblomastix strix]